jgi:signal transduction histidine kinase
MLCSILITPVANTLHYFNQKTWNPDYYILQFSVHRSNYAMALITYIGGISAATSMIIISSFSLSIMISHNVIFPFLIKIKNKFKFESIELGKLPELSKYISIALVLSSSYLFFAGPAFHANLSSIGLLSFSAVAQLAPAGIGAIFWKEGNFFGAISGMIAGFLLWLLTLVIPFVISNSIVEHDFGLIVLSNYINYSLKNFIGMSEMGLLSYGVMLSLSINTLLYIIVSLYTPTNSSEKNQAEVFVDIFQYSRVYESAIAWKGKASAPDLINLLVSFIGEKRTNELLDEYSSKYGTSWKSASEAEPKFVNFIENSLSNVIGNASARLLINSIVDEDEIKHREVVELLYKAQQLLRDHRELRETYNKLNEAKIELEKANSKLKEQDILKDEFLSTVTHELRTPITSIRALCEIIASEPNMEESQRAVFLQIIIDESIRISKIIDSVLDLEKYEAGNQILNASLVELKELIHYAINQFVITSSVKFEVLCSESLKPVILDRDKITQLLINLISNSIKHNSVSDLVITITASITNDLLVLIVQDNGCGIDETDLPYIFDKFYQSMNKKYIKSNSSGLGLAICKKIVTLHGGTIEATNHSKGGAVFRICLPVSFD